MKGKPIFRITTAELDKDRWVFDENCTNIENVDGTKLVLTQNINYIPHKDAFNGERVYIGMFDEVGQWDFNDKNETKL